MRPKVILTTIPSDSHTWNLIYMQLLLEENGFEVFNLGPCTSYEEVLQTCTEITPDLILVSTVNGHGYLEGKMLIEKLKQLPVIQDIPLYIGGKLSTDKNLSYLYAMELEMAGYTKVYYENEEVDDFVAQLHKIAKKVQ